MAHDSADRAFAADEDRLDITAVLVGHEKRDEARTAGEVDHVDVVAGIVQQLVRGALPVLEMRLEQRIVARPQAKEVVGGAIVCARGRS